MTTGRSRGWMAIGAALALSATGCAAEDPGAYVHEAAAKSAEADRAIADGQGAEAERHLRAITELAIPRAIAREDARVLRQDAFDRWARLALARGDGDAALRLVSRGLALGEHDDVFTANLLTTRGRAHEAAGRDRDAASDYHRALRIEETLLDRALGDGE